MVYVRNVQRNITPIWAYMAIEKAQVSLSQILKKPIFVKYTSPSRVGTVDKFQGQETEIVIVSMEFSMVEF
jgi:hypothetical protein